MVLLDLLHVQRAGFFKFLKSGIDRELSQLNLNVDNTRLQVIPFLSIPSTSNILDLTKSSSAAESRIQSTTFSLAALPKVKLEAHPQSLKFQPRLASLEQRASTRLEEKASLMEVKKSQIDFLVNQPKYLSRSFETVKDLSKNKICLNQNSYFRLIASKYTPREAILYQKSWSCKLVVKVLLTIHEKHALFQDDVETKSMASSYKKKVELKNHPSISNKRKRFSNKTANTSYLRSAQSCNLLRTKPVYYATFGSAAGSLEQRASTNLVKVGKVEKTLLAFDRTQLEKKPIIKTKSDLASLKISHLNKTPTTKGALNESTFGTNGCISEDKIQKRDHELFLVLGELPLMTRRGHFIIHGSPRVILSQLIRTPGIYFTQKNNELQADCVPEQGPWLCIYKSFNDDKEINSFLSENKQISHTSKGLPSSLLSIARNAPDCVLRTATTFGSAARLASIEQRASTTTTSEAQSSNLATLEAPCSNREALYSSEANLVRLGSAARPKVELEIKKDMDQIQRKASYFCYTKQFSSMPFSLIYSTFRVFELHSQFTDQTLLLTKLKTLEKIRKFKEVITTLLTFTWKKRIRRRLQRLYTKRCFTLTQQFEKTKVLFRLKNKLILGPLSRKSFNEKLGISSCINTGINQNAFTNEFFDLAQLSDTHHKKSVNDNLMWRLTSKTYLPSSSTNSSVGTNNFYQRSTKFWNKNEARKLEQATSTDRRSLNKYEVLPAISSSAELEAKWLNSTTLLSRDLTLIARFLDGYKIMPLDDIDDLNNQRVRTSSDQIQQQVRVGLFRFKKMFVKLISSGNATSHSQTITDFLNGALREFFGSNPLSQFLDQTNPLAEITHKRRISKLGLNGIQRESATLKVRTIHSTYFGRICPIETPEGLNAGLVNSLTCLSRVDQKGQLVTPLSVLIERQKQEQFFYYSNKENTALSTTDTALLKFQRLPNQFIYTKNESQFQQLEPNKVKLRVKSDLQTISLATALIPFLAYDDANRALMGSNMQRQAVPLILPERPIVRTGMESLVINESGHSFQASCGGFVSYISAQHMVILCNTLNKRLLV